MKAIALVLRHDEGGESDRSAILCQGETRRLAPGADSPSSEAVASRLHRSHNADIRELLRRLVIAGCCF
jgi:hypothetical protein